eukprot:7577154-Alexandrium_andersonii.AAC.1
MSQAPAGAPRGRAPRYCRRHARASRPRRSKPGPPLESPRPRTKLAPGPRPPSALPPTQTGGPRTPP